MTPTGISGKNYSYDYSVRGLTAGTDIGLSYNSADGFWKHYRRTAPMYGPTVYTNLPSMTSTTAWLDLEVRADAISGRIDWIVKNEAGTILLADGFNHVAGNMSGPNLVGDCTDIFSAPIQAGANQKRRQFFCRL